MAASRRRGFARFAHAPWWVHVLATLGGVVVLAVAALVVAGVFFVDFVQEHGPISSEIPRQSAVAEGEAAELARSWSPILRFDSRELFVPIRQSAYVGETQLKEEAGRSVTVLDPTPVLEKLPVKQRPCLHGRCQYFLDVRGVEPHPPRHSERAYGVLEKHLIRTGEKPTVYAHVTHYDDSGEYAVQYWFLYLFNYRLNEHESDWEQITIRLDEDKQPVDAFYSAHSGGDVREWSRVEKSGVFPVVYPALGSHANYFAPGRHRVRIVCKRVLGSISSCFRGRKFLVDLANGEGEAFGPSDYTLSALAGPVFVGSYGSGNYVVLTRKPDILADPRNRRAWADPLQPFR